MGARSLVEGERCEVSSSSLFKRWEVNEEEEKSLGLMVWEFWLGISVLSATVWDLEFRFEGLGFRDSGSGVGVKGSGAPQVKDLG